MATPLPLWYVANQAYMFSNILPVYRAYGGEFLVRSLQRWVQFKHYLHDLNAFPERRTLFDSPAVRIVDYRKPQSYDGVFISLNGILINKSGPKSKSVFVGHGTGDKPYHGDTAQRIISKFDYHFITGPKHLAKLVDAGLNLPAEKLISIGNLRFDDYVNGKISRERVLANLGIKNPNRKTVLYAPTWTWGNGTLAKFGFRFCKELSTDYNVIIRPHTYDRRNVPALKRQVRRAGLQNVYFSAPADLRRHDTMDDFLVSDILISDTSSIVYEYLITRKPVISIPTDFTGGHNMPANLDIKSVATPFDENINARDQVARTLDQHETHRAAYEELLHNCFYFNDGGSVARAGEFMNQLAS